MTEVDMSDPVSLKNATTTTATTTTTAATTKVVLAEHYPHTRVYDAFKHGFEQGVDGATRVVRCLET